MLDKEAWEGACCISPTVASALRLQWAVISGPPPTAWPPSSRPDFFLLLLLRLILHVLQHVSSLSRNSLRCLLFPSCAQRAFFGPAWLPNSLWPAIPLRHSCGSLMAMVALLRIYYVAAHVDEKAWPACARISLLRTHIQDAAWRPATVLPLRSLAAVNRRAGRTTMPGWLGGAGVSNRNGHTESEM
jgi:hypothetical protein